MPETNKFQVSGIIETLGSIISHGTSSKFADVRTHPRKVSKENFIFNMKRELSLLFFLAFLEIVLSGWLLGLFIDSTL